MSSTRFKVGDKVKRIRDKDGWAWSAHKPAGEIFTVSTVRNGWLGLEGAKYDLDPRPFNSGNFVLVEEASGSEQSDEVLLEMVNSSVAAGHELYKRHGERLEVTFDHGLWEPVGKPNLHGYRIKPKPSFKPFQIRSWEVRMEGDKIRVGCQTFDAKALLRALSQLTDIGADCNSVDNSGSVKLAACRKGVSSNGHTITWDEADKLLAALQKAFKEPA
jgi:hypothetical protein